MNYSLFLSVARGLEYLLEDEIKTLGFTATKVTPYGVFLSTSLRECYRLCLSSRLASRVHLMLLEAPIKNERELYDVCRTVPWHELFAPQKSIAVEFHGSAPFIRHTLFGAQLIKDAIVDTFRDKENIRPSVDPKNRDVLIHAHLKKGILSLSLDFAGRSLHQRGFRLESGDAPLRETTAAAMLMRASWPQLLNEGKPFLDPFCGSGTLAIEAALMAANIAPGLLSDNWGFKHFFCHDEACFQQEIAKAKALIREPSISIYASDKSPSLVQKAIANAKRANVENMIQFSVKPFEALKKPELSGLIVSNPPYGERLSDEKTLLPMYQQLGQVLHDLFSGWDAYFSIASPLLARAIGLRSHRQYTIYHGPILCKLYAFQLSDENRIHEVSKENPFSPSATMLYNRINKNVRHLKKWVLQNGIDCYRFYDADLPEYAFIMDWYDGEVVVQEYKAPSEIPLHRIEKHRLDVMQVLPKVFNIAPSAIIFKERKRQKGTSQYEKLEVSGQQKIVKEGNTRLFVNLRDYLDTGLFLDLRRLRVDFGKLPQETRFLNCFCYTGSASVHAALSGAITTNVDLSNTYLSWARENFRLNKIDSNRHQFVQFDYLKWMSLTDEKFDVIFLDPPIFSNSKRMEGTFDILRDQSTLIENTMRLLKPEGKLYFCAYLKNFRLDEGLSERYQIKNITHSTLDPDFSKAPGHRVRYLITHPQNA